MKLPRPQLSLRVLPLMDIIFILLAFFMILPHGVYQKKTAKLAPLENLKKSDNLLRVINDVSFFIRIYPESRVQVRAQLSSWRWKKDERTISSKKEFLFFTKDLKKLLQLAQKFQKKLEKKWKKAKKRGEKLSRSPKILIQVEIHPQAKINLPIYLMGVLKKWTRYSQNYNLALRRVEE